MSRPTFDTGKPHQKRTAIWARQRISDAGGRRFLKEDDQSGVLLADGVGMGKTWEALAATALILAKEGRQRGKGSVLVICPPNLVTKWEDELAAGSPFRERLERWVRQHDRRSAKPIAETLASVVPVRRATHVQTRRRYGKFRPESGTYLVSHGLLHRGGHGLSALRRHGWDVIIVDEAHHGAARKALMAVVGRCRYKLLLTATPFQLEPREWNKLAHALVRGSRPLSRSEVRRYLDAVALRFKDPAAPGPSRAQIAAAEDVLRKVAARTVPPKSARKYSILSPTGTELPVGSRFDELDDRKVASLLADLSTESQTAERRAGFELRYLAPRFHLATRDDPTFVATKLRRFLSMGDHDAPSPRLVALRTWSQRRWREDIESSLADGCPRKTIVFTAWVGERTSGEAASLQTTLSAAFLAALEAVRQRHHKNWGAWRMAGERWIRGLHRRLSIPHDVYYRPWERQVHLLPVILDRLAKDELAAVLAGASKKFRRRLGHHLQRQLDLIADTWEDYAGGTERSSVEGRAARRRLNDAVAGLDRWGEQRGLTYVERYTGSEDRITRDRAAAGFREVTSPWVLVASNVGAEGIDLHTYTRRIVHYDLEWNPARMEQREGRGDRVGRVLRDPLSIVYCLVPRTYDERMFHQLVARDRWHGVLLGKAAARMASDEGAQQVRLESAEFIKKVRLNLAPR